MMPFFDDSDLPEIPLTGGRITEGVVRIGETVRRPRSESSDFVGRLLGHVRGNGFDGVPEYLGIDGKGRDCFSYLPGEVEPKWRSWPDETVAAFGHLLRGFHEATRGSSLAGNAGVVCHHDPGPNNVVFRDGLPVALIDFDMAAPGEAIEDLAYAAWAWCISSNSARPPAEIQAAQVALLMNTYQRDAFQLEEIWEAILERISRNAAFWQGRKERATDATEEARCVKMIEWTERERGFVVGNEDEFRIGVEASIRTDCPPAMEGISAAFDP